MDIIALIDIITLEEFLALWSTLDIIYLMWIIIDKSYEKEKITRCLMIIFLSGPIAWLIASMVFFYVSINVLKRLRG